MKKTIITLAITVACTTTAFAQQSNGCAPNAANCTGTNQSNSGDITNPGQSSSAATQLGNSTASNVSGVTADPRSQVTQDANNTTTGTISGGNTSSLATGGAANGNKSSNDNRSSVGDTASNSGGNTLSTGPATSSVGDTTAKGGAGGAGGAGGSSVAAGGTGTGGKSSSVATGGTSKGGDASQGQQQGQQQASRSTATNTARNTSALTGGNSTASNGQNIGNGQSTTIGGSSYSDNSRTIFIPPVVPPTPPSVVGIGQVIQTTLACGPLQQVVKTPIIATNFGIFHDGHQQQGFTYDLASVVDVAGQPVEYRYEWMPNGIDQRIIGSQVTMFATVVAVSSAQSLALGGGGGSGSWGQAGGGSSGSMSQLVTNIQVRDCEVGFLHSIIEPPKAETPVIETPREVLKRHIVRPRKIAGCAPKK